MGKDTAYKVSYFPGKGNGEIIRLILSIADVNFEDERLSWEEWMKLKTDLFGLTPKHTAIIDEVYECAMDAQREVIKIFFEKDKAEKDKMIANFKSVTLPRLDEYIKVRSEVYGQDGYIVGKSITLADLQLYNLVDQATERIGADVFTPYPELKRHENLVKSNPNIAKWFKEMPKPQY